MNIIIDSSSMIPIYEQISASIKHMIMNGELAENDPLPSVRVLSRDLRISALTVKKAYDALEEEGLTATVHGKGTYVCAPNPAMIREEQRRELEADLDAVAKKAKLYGVTRSEINDMLDIIMED